MTLLFGLFQTATSLNEKMEVEQALSAATHFPMEVGSDELIAIVLENTQEVVRFFADRVDDEPFELLQQLETVPMAVQTQ